MWQMKVKQENNTVDIYIYDTVYNGDDWKKEGSPPREESAKGVREILASNKDAEIINVHINSLGGDVMEGTAILNQLKAHKAKKHVYIDGFACSVASVIAMAGDKIIMPKNAMMMIHNCWTFAIGNSAELRKTADDMDKIMEGNRTAYLEKAGDKLSEEKLIELLDAETYLTANECLELGLCDTVLDSEVKITVPEETANEQTSKVAAFVRENILEPPNENQSENSEQSQQGLSAPDDIEQKQPEAPATEKAPNEALIFLAALLSAAEREQEDEKT